MKKTFDELDNEIAILEKKGKRLMNAIVIVAIINALITVTTFTIIIINSK